jgi:uncharacterized protein with GYD domain
MKYITLFKPKGKGVEAVKYLKDLQAPKGIIINEIYFTFGQYDATIIFEATNNETALNFIMEVGFATGYTVETMAAVSRRSGKLEESK